MGDAGKTDGKTVRPGASCPRGMERRPEARASGDTPGSAGVGGWEMALQVLGTVTEVAGVLPGSAVEMLAPQTEFPRGTVDG